MIQREWSSGLREFLARDTVQMFMLPPSTDTMVLRLNRDPQITRAAEIARNQRQNADSEKERLREPERRPLQDGHVRPHRAAVAKPERHAIHTTDYTHAREPATRRARRQV